MISLISIAGMAYYNILSSIIRVDGFAMMPNFSFGTALTTYKVIKSNPTHSCIIMKETEGAHL
ncbi:MAG: hypothetical protein IJ493_12265 [Clostridia bacterium]|nr:hypothetical protein [Clostridia bacterium]